MACETPGCDNPEKPGRVLCDECLARLAEERAVRDAEATR